VGRNIASTRFDPNLGVWIGLGTSIPFPKWEINIYASLIACHIFVNLASFCDRHCHTHVLQLEQAFFQLNYALQLREGDMSAFFMQL
jgi:hypothetical protein